MFIIIKECNGGASVQGYLDPSCLPPEQGDCGVLGTQDFVCISSEVNDPLAAAYAQQSTAQRIPSFRKPHLSNYTESVVPLLAVEVSQKFAIQCTVAQMTCLLV